MGKWERGEERPASGKRVAEDKREGGGRQGPFNGEHSERAQEGLLEATAEDLYSKLVQMPEY